MRVVYTKYDGSLHWNKVVRLLGQDDHGTWVGAPTGVVMRRGNERRFVRGHAHVGLLQPDAWWTAWFNGKPERLEIYVDVSTPPVWNGASEVSMVDLDLDVCRVRATGEVRILDEEEFAEHRVRYDYPADVVAAATAAAHWLRDALTDRRPPFDSEYQAWLSLVD